MTLASGQTLNHYEILGPLGAGAMGEVYRAKDTRLEREVAIKVLPEELADDEERLRRFEREAKALAALNHPSVATIYGVDRVEDVYYFALELVPGEGLDVRLGRGPLPVEEALGVCRQIAAGLEAAHAAGVVHRDLKPGNVHVTPDGAGQAARLRARQGGRRRGRDGFAAHAEAGRVLGTPSYMSPEQARGEAVGTGTDVWALGCVLFECLSGVRPFDRPSLAALLASILVDSPRVDGAARGDAAVGARAARALPREGPGAEAGFDLRGPGGPGERRGSRALRRFRPPRRRGPGHALRRPRGGAGTGRSDDRGGARRPRRARAARWRAGGRQDATGRGTAAPRERARDARPAWPRVRRGRRPLRDLGRDPGGHAAAAARGEAARHAG